MRYADNISLTKEQEEENNELYNDPDMFMMGEDIIAWEYEQKTGRSLLKDTIISALVWAIIIMIPLSIIAVNRCHKH